MQAEDRRVALRNLKLIAVLAAGMVSFFAVLDHFAYPEFVALFAALRWTCASLIMIMLLMVRSKLGKRYYKAFTVALPLLPAFFVAITIFVTKDPATIYYAGLSLCIVAIGFLFHWTYKEAFAVSGIVLLLYLLACAPVIMSGLDARTGSGLFSNLVFLIATGAVVVTGSVAHHGVRVEEFRGRERLRQEKIALRAKAQELEQALGELRETEGQLIQSGKMASLGQLSAGVIHEIGNPLNHSNQALFLLKRRLRQFPEDPAIGEAVEDIQDSIDRMKEIVRELREFSHKRSEVLNEFPLREAVVVAERMLGKQIDDHAVTVEIDIDPELRVRGVKNQLAQVFINLVHNAIQAMASAGEEKAKRIRLAAREEGEEVLVSIRDNGPGIPNALIDKIFDPFFTTKDAGEGTGLGLSICFRIVEAHRGTIAVESDGVSYTEFLVRLPSVSSPEDSAVVSHHLASFVPPSCDSPEKTALNHEKAV
jgi:two-component system sensor histidine kinase PhcS